MLQFYEKITLLSDMARTHKAIIYYTEELYIK